jgi:hypothetical protein
MDDRFGIWYVQWGSGRYSFALTRWERTKLKVWIMRHRVVDAWLALTGKADIE